MIIYMNSKTFQDMYIVEEKKKDILDAQYVLISTRIRKHSDKYKNILVAVNSLYPNSDTMSKLYSNEQKKAYFKQLDNRIDFISLIVKASIKEDYDVVLICSKNEWKLKYMKWLAEYIMDRFGCPVYNYKKLKEGKIKKVKFDEKKVLKKCKKHVENKFNNEIEKLSKTKQGRKQIIDKYKSLEKSDLIKLTKKEGLYKKGMSRRDMLDVLEVCL